MANETTVDPRYMSYDKDEMERILASVEHIDDTPTSESNNVVKSGGVAAAFGAADEKYATVGEVVEEVDDGSDDEPEPEPEE